MKIVITGITGQDGSLMADYLLKNEPTAHIYGVVRQLSVPNHSNISHLKDHGRVTLLEGDITDPHSMSGIIEGLQPDYFINLAANSFVGTSWKNPTQVVNTNTLSVLNQLETIRKHSPKTRYYQAGSSEEFGDVAFTPQNEAHPLRPRSPYAASKAAARHLVKVYRDSYGIYAVAGWLFNHEGVRRGGQFVTRKITKAVAKIVLGLKNRCAAPPLVLGNLEAKRDWSDAEDFVDGIWKMLNQDKPKDYVLSSGETHSVREFVETAFNVAGIPVIDTNPDRVPPTMDSNALQINYKISLHNGEQIFELPVVCVSPEFYRPAEVDILLGDSTAARKELGWSPKVNFETLVQKMVLQDLHELGIH